MQTTLFAQLLAEGFRPGTPADVEEWVRRLDAHWCRRARCQRCHRRGLAYRPLHRGMRYVVLGICPRCRSDQEV